MEDHKHYISDLGIVDGDDESRSDYKEHSVKVSFSKIGLMS